MLKQIKNSALNVFNAKHDRIQLLYKIPFTEIYPSEFDKITTALQDEISINSISLNETQLNKYLNLVKDKIEKTYIDNPNKCFIDKWVKEFKLDVKAFPFYSDSKIIKILATSFDQYNLSYEDKKKARLMQSDFFNHALLLEAKKILKFINELLNKDNISKDVSNPTHKDQNKKNKKLPEKWYALQYLLELKANCSNPPINHEGAFIKAELEKIGRERIEKSSGQSFYRAVKSHYKSMDKEALIKKSFGEDWKEIILSLPNNTPETIKYLETI